MLYLVAIIAMLTPNPSMADALLDAIYGKYETDIESDVTCTCPEDESYENGEHMSWELGTNDSLPTTEVIVYPYGDTQDAIDYMSP